MRLLPTAHGLPEPEIDRPYRLSDGSFVEGGRRDLMRYERLTDLGRRVIRVSADDIRRRPEETVARVHRALARVR